MCMQTCPQCTICKVIVLVERYICKNKEKHKITLGIWCVYISVGGVYIFFLAVPTQVFSARQSPCQYCGLYHLSGLAWGQRQSPVWLKMDFVVDQWDLGGQTVCHCILPRTLHKLSVCTDSLLLPAWLLWVEIILHIGCNWKPNSWNASDEMNYRILNMLKNIHYIGMLTLKGGRCCSRKWTTNDAAVSFRLNPVSRPYGAIVKDHQCEPTTVERQMASPEQQHIHTIDHKRAAQQRSQSTLIVPGGWLQYKSVALLTQRLPNCATTTHFCICSYLLYVIQQFFLWRCLTFSIMKNRQKNTHEQNNKQTKNPQKPFTCCSACCLMAAEQGFSLFDLE